MGGDETDEARRAALAAELERHSQRLAATMREPAAHEWPDIELTIPQLRTLGFLKQGPRRMGDIAAHLGSSLSAATVMVERLEGKGLAARSHDPADRRVVVCRLTDAGQDALGRFWRLQRLRLTELADLLTIPELERLLDATRIIAEALERRAAAGGSPGGPGPGCGCSGA